MRRFYTSMILVALIAAVPVHGAVWKKSMDEAQSEARKKDQLMLVEMYASWCGWCKKMAQEVFPSEAFQKATQDLVLLQLNTEDGKEGTRISQELQVRSLPTLFLLTPDLMIAGMISGYAPAPQFVQQLEKTRAEWEALEARMALHDAGKLAAPAALELTREIASRRGFTEAQKRFRSISSDRSSSAGVRSEAFYELARMQAYLGKHDDAIKSIRGLEQIAKGGEVSQRGEVLLAEVYFLKKDYDRSLAALRKFQSEHPDSPLMDNVRRLLPRVQNAATAQ